MRKTRPCVFLARERALGLGLSRCSEGVCLFEDLSVSKGDGGAARIVGLSCVVCRGGLSMDALGGG